MASGAFSIGAADERAIRDLVGEYGASWNRHDMAAMAALFADDASWVNIVGWHWPDKAAVVAGHEGIHRSFFHDTDIEIADITLRVLASDIVAAVVLLKVGPFLPPDGMARPASDNRLSLIMANRDGRWRIAHGHNTVIDPAAAPFDPAKTGGRRA